MPGMDAIGASVWPFSQFKMVQETTPNRTATSFWVSPNIRRLFLTCSPRVVGANSYGFGINDLRTMRVNCKKVLNPCQCGYLGDENGLCHCTAEQVSRYCGRISGPLLDRIDLHVEVSRPKFFLLQHDGPAPESSERVRQRVIAARAIQEHRTGCTNAQLDSAALKAFCRISTADRKLLAEASKQHALSPRACLRILKVARTLADLDAATDIITTHVAEAISYRNCWVMPTMYCG